MEIIELFIFSKQLLKVSNSLLEYVKTCSEYDRMKEDDRIDRIKM